MLLVLAREDITLYLQLFGIVERLLIMLVEALNAAIVNKELCS